jgi:hypothetical protein
MARLTPENVTNPWIHYEIGALSHTPSDKVWTVLLDLKPSEVGPPLGWRQHTDITNEREVLEMLESINRTTESPKEPDDLRILFGRLWPEFQAEVSAIRDMNRTLPARRDPEEVLDEVLGIVRDSSRNTHWRTEKTLRMVEQIYAMILRREPPVLRDLSDPNWRAAVIQQILSPDPTPYEKELAREASSISDTVTAKLES